jgi:hypothetical protein
MTVARSMNAIEQGNRRPLRPLRQKCATCGGHERLQKRLDSIGPPSVQLGDRLLDDLQRPRRLVTPAWGILLAYNLIRLEMERTADDFGVEPKQISFVSAMRLICDTWVWCSIASPGAIPTRLSTMRELFTRLVLPARRSARSYPAGREAQDEQLRSQAAPTRGAVLNRTGIGLSNEVPLHLVGRYLCSTGADRSPPPPRGAPCPGG